MLYYREYHIVLSDERTGEILYSAKRSLSDSAAEKYLSDIIECFKHGINQNKELFLSVSASFPERIVISQNSLF